MAFDSDVALLGTGVAPLVAAARLIAEGKSVLLLNPEWDFFREESELPLDPLWPVSRGELTPQRISRSLPENVLSELRPDFPGAIELWPEPSTRAEGYHDLEAPHVRSRSRLWVRSPDRSSEDFRHRDWEMIENLYVEGSDAGLNPIALEGLSALRRFPGFSGAAALSAEESEELRAIQLPKMCDVDVARYRNGLLEYIRERLGPERVIINASQVDLSPEGVRFFAGGQPRTALLRDGLLVFWTPALTQWVLSQAKKNEVKPRVPSGIRLWEEWSLLSRDALDPAIVGMFENVAAWAELEGAGAPMRGGSNRMAVLRGGPLVAFDAAVSDPGLRETWASAEAFRSLSKLCLGFLKWERFTVRSMRSRSVFEWGEKDRGSVWPLSQGPLRASVVCGCDGPVAEVARAARAACDSVSTISSEVTE